VERGHESSAHMYIWAERIGFVEGENYNIKNITINKNKKVIIKINK